MFALALTLALAPTAALADSIEFSVVGGSWSFDSNTGVLTITNTGGVIIGTGSFDAANPTLAGIGITGSSLDLNTGSGGTLPGTYPAGGSISVSQDTNGWAVGAPACGTGGCLNGSFTDVQTTQNAAGGYSFTANFLAGSIDQNLLNVLVNDGYFQGIPAGNSVVGFSTGNLDSGSCTTIEGDNICSGTLGSLDVTVTPVPEPGTLALFGTGLLSLAGFLRRRLLS